MSSKTKLPRVVHALSDVTVKVAPTDEGTVGHYSEDGGIEISPKQTVEEAHYTLCHELIHYALDKSGIAALLERYSGSNTPDAIEEAIVVALENFLIKPGVLVFNPKAGSDWKTVTFKK